MAYISITAGQVKYLVVCILKIKVLVGRDNTTIQEILPIHTELVTLAVSNNLN